MMPSRPLLLKAAEIIERDAQALYECHTSDGDWGEDTDVKADYDEMMATANELRRCAG